MWAPVLNRKPGQDCLLKGNLLGKRRHRQEVTNTGSEKSPRLTGTNCVLPPSQRVPCHCGEVTLRPGSPTTSLLGSWSTWQLYLHGQLLKCGKNQPSGVKVTWLHWTHEETKQISIENSLRNKALAEDRSMVISGHWIGYGWTRPVRAYFFSEVGTGGCHLRLLICENLRATERLLRATISPIVFQSFPRREWYIFNFSVSPSLYLGERENVLQV